MTHPVIIFDGVCNLCNASVRFILRYDRSGHFRFSPFQSGFAKNRLMELGFPELESESVILIENGRVYWRSTAALKIVRKLNGLWPLVYALIVIPKPIRDFVYTQIARNRYQLFGRQEACMLPEKNLASRFIE